MNYYTECISVPLAEKLEEKGMPITITEDIVDFCTENEHEELTTNAIYAEVFDWLMSEKNIRLNVVIKCNYLGRWYPVVNELIIFSDKCFDTWHEAANAAIEKALTLI